MKNFANDEAREIKNQIEQFLFLDWKKGQLRIKLSEVGNPVDKKNFENIISKNCQIKYFDYPLVGKDNISKANRFFDKEINTKKCYDIYQTVVNDFYFSLMVMDKDADAGELFMVINKTALDLTIADLVKSLFVTQETSQLAQQEVSQKWNEKIIKKVCVSPENSSDYKKSQDILDFLITFREAGFGETYKYSWRQSNELYEFFEKQIEEKEKDQLLGQMTEYAEVYHKIKNVLDNQSWWANWPFEIIYLISDFLLLDYSWLLSLNLLVYFRFNKKNQTEKEIIIRELKKMLIFAFRVLTVKDKNWEKKYFWEIWGSSLKRLMGGNDDNLPILIDRKSPKMADFFKEFEQENSTKFYEELKRWRPEKRSEEKVWKFVIRTYYWKKILSKNDISEDKKEQMRKEMLEYEIGYLEDFEKSSSEAEEFKSDLGNITLLSKSQKESKYFSKKKWDKEKRNFIKDLGENCLMNYLEEDWTQLENISDLIAKRKKYLIEDFGILGIFELD